MSGMVTVVPGEASETEDEDDAYCVDTVNSNRQAAKSDDQAIRIWDLKNAKDRCWSTHVDEKLEERWRLLGTDAVKLAEKQVSTQRKQLENMKQNIANIQYTLQTVSSAFRQAAENLGHVESNLSLLQEGAKLIPDFSALKVNDGSSKRSSDLGGLGDEIDNRGDRKRKSS